MASQNKLTKVILQVLKEYKKKYNNITARKINEGKCNRFASDVIDLLGDTSGIEIVELWERGAGRVGSFKDLGHTWLEYKGKFYDAEAPYGVGSVYDLPELKRVREKYPDYNIESYKEVKKSNKDGMVKKKPKNMKVWWDDDSYRNIPKPRSTNKQQRQIILEGRLLPPDLSGEL